MKSFRGKKVAVIGDVMLDRFLEGVVTRKSPEADAPIVLWQNESNVLGGAANVAANIKALGGIPKLFSVIGSDTNGRIIRELLEESKIIHRFIVDKARTTTLKTRIFVDGKYLLRLDKEVKNPIPKVVATRLLKQISQKVHSFDAIAFSDYGKGVFSRHLANSLIFLTKKYQIPVIADIKPQNILWFKNVTIVKPNASETFKISGTHNLSLAGKKISRKLNSDVLITRGSKGMLLYERVSKQHKIIKGIHVRVKDIIGAGDVVLACLSLGIASGETLRDASFLANIAAALSVEKHGTATVSFDEINTFFKIYK